MVYTDEQIMDFINSKTKFSHLSSIIVNIVHLDTSTIRVFYKKPNYRYTSSFDIKKRKIKRYLFVKRNLKIQSILN